MLTSKELVLLKDGEAWVEYYSDLYEWIGTDERGRNILSDVNDGYAIYVSDKALLSNSDFYFSLKY